MLPTLLLQPSDFANFDIELNGPNLLPLDAIEPEIAFAELLSLGTRTPPAPAPVAGQLLPEGGKALPVVAAEPEPADSAMPEADGAQPVSTVPATLPAPLLPPEIRSAAIPPVVAKPTPQPETRTILSAAVLQVQTSPVEPPASAIAVRTPAAAPAVAAAVVESPMQAQTRPDQRPDKAIESAPVAPRVTPQQPPAPAKVLTPAVMPITNIQPAAELAGRLRIQLPAKSPIMREVTALPEVVAREPADQVPVATARELRAPVPPATAPTVASVQASPVAAGETAPASVLTTGAAPAGPSPAATSASTATPNLPLATRIDVPVKDTAWGEQLGQRLQLMANNQLQTAEIRLTPAELGPMRIQIAIDDGAANVTFQAQHAVTREAIEQALPRLREMLAENGVTLSQANVGEQGVQHGRRDGANTATGSSYRVDDSAAEQPQDALHERAERSTAGLVDTFA